MAVADRPVSFLFDVFPLNLLMSIIVLTLRMLLTQKAEEHPQVELQELPHFINSDYSI